VRRGGRGREVRPAACGAHSCDRIRRLEPGCSSARAALHVGPARWLSTQPTEGRETGRGLWPGMVGHGPADAVWWFTPLRAYKTSHRPPAAAQRREPPAAGRSLVVDAVGRGLAGARAVSTPWH
jgi:hypothetical protein